MGERRLAGVGLLRGRREVHQLGNVMRDRGEVLEAIFGDGFDAHLEAEVGDDRDQIAVAGALAVPVDRALHLHGPADHAGDGVGDATARVVVQVHADTAVDVGHDGLHRLLHVVRQRAAVGVAQDQALGAGHGRGLEHSQRELGVVLVAVEEVLGVEEHPTPLSHEVLDRVGHHRDALVERRAERLGDVVVPALADDADHLGAGGQQVLERLVLVDLALDPPGRAERDERGRRELQLVLGPGEELVVLGVGARPTALDVVHTQPVELLGDAELVLDRQRDALQLAAVSQRRVVDLDGRGCGHGVNPPRG